MEDIDIRTSFLALRCACDDEIKQLVELRNRYRQWFFDTREIPLDQSRAWFRTRSASDCVLAITIANIGGVVGTIGWKDVSGEPATEIGRLAIDYSAALALGIPGRFCRRIAYNAGQSVLGYLFSIRKMDRVFMRNRVGNKSVSNLARRSGLVRYDGRSDDAEIWCMTRARWDGGGEGN